jgi:hypothetical protein
MKAIYSLVFLILSSLVYSQADNIPVYYFGQTPPDTIPMIFAPGTICLENRFEARGAFSPDGKYLFFVRHDGKNGDIYWINASIINKFRSK